MLSCVFISNLLFKRAKTRYLYDSRYSYFLQQGNSNVSFTVNSQKMTSLNTEISFSTISPPVFILELKKSDNEGSNKYVYMNSNCQIVENVIESHKNNLIKLNCNNNYYNVPLIFSKIKDLNAVEMNLIDNRRWQIIIKKNNKLIKIEFPEGIPDISNFQKLDNKFKLSEKYSLIDLRFNDKIAVLK